MLKLNLDKLDIEPKSRVIVAMSGGVDSTAVALLSKNAGLEVIGITLDMVGSSEVIADAQRVAKEIGIDHFVANYKEEFDKEIIGYFIMQYKKGLTPNPCSRCNRTAKTKYLFDQMQKYDAKYILTGHYARNKKLGEQYYIIKNNSLKDQSYYLASIEPYYMNLMRFPLGDYTKEEIREYLKENNITIHQKKDSEDACFLEGIDYRTFLEKYIHEPRVGSFILNGEKIGNHKGIHNYTIGQRRGLEISYKEPLYVKQIDPKSCEVTLAKKDEITTNLVKLHSCEFYPAVKLIGKYTCKLRYRMKDVACTLEQLPDKEARLLLDSPVFAPANGQYAVIYDGDIVLGYGIIAS